MSVVPIAYPVEVIKTFKPIAKFKAKCRFCNKKSEFILYQVKKEEKGFFIIPDIFRKFREVKYPIVCNKCGRGIEISEFSKEKVLKDIKNKTYPDPFPPEI